MSYRLMYFVADDFPAWRLDVQHLFGEELPKFGIKTTWSMRRSEPGPCTATEQGGQRVFLARSASRGNLLAKAFNRVAEALCELHLFAHMIAQRYDLIQVRDGRYLAALWAWLAARITGARFTYWLSFPFPENDAEMAKRSSGVRRLFLLLRSKASEFWVYGFVMRRADHVFVQSEEMLRSIEKRGIPAARMTAVPMGVPARLTRWSAELKVTPIPGRVAYIGTLAASRRLEILIEAFVRVHEAFPYARLILVGEGECPADRRALERRAEQLGISAFVEFTGFIPMEAAWQIAASAAAGVSPIYVDDVLRVGSPTKLVEYLALGRPVVCNDHPEQSQVIRDSGAGLCVPWDVTAFGDALIDLLDRPNLAESRGARGPAWVEDHRTYPRIASSVARVYHRLLGRDGP